MTFDVGEGVACDLDRLIAGRLLVQASSGQGKTWAIRRLLEQTHGHVQHLVIDPEGEYSTLREKFDYVHAAPKGGDVVAHPRYAAMLATELLKLGASAILDIYELNPQDRKAFVKNFCTALVNAPRDLWHPCLIVLDEAHVFCPEKEQAESAEAVKALASRGRKRAFALVLATQRLSKLAKDAAAEMGNKLIGGCRLDIDVKRAAEELGFTDVSNRQSLRTLTPGQFYAAGSAFTGNKALVVSGDKGYGFYRPFTVGKVKTTHPEPGQAAAPTPPATEKVRAVLKRLEALPAEAEEREKSIETLKKENAELRRAATVAVARKSDPVIEQVRVEVPVLDPELAARLLSVVHDFDARMIGLQASMGVVTELRTAIDQVRVSVLAKVGAGGDPARGNVRADHLRPRASGTSPSAPTQVGSRGAPTRAADASGSGTARGHHTPAASDPSVGKAGLRRMLVALAQRPKGLTRRQLGLRAQVSSKGGSFDTYLSKARVNGWVDTSREWIQITDAGYQALGSYEPLPEGRDLLAHYLSEFGISGAARMLKEVAGVWPSRIDRDELGARANVSAAGGSFDTYLSRLKTLELVDVTREGIKLSAELA